MNKFSSILKNKLKFYSVLMAILLVGSVITLTFNYESYSCDMRDGEVLTLKLTGRRQSMWTPLTAGATPVPSLHGLCISSRRLR